MKTLDKVRGCLVGGAAGDALGYAVEFLDNDSIIETYGKDGITEYDLTGGIARISDDTQMSLFTANGLLYGTTQGLTSSVMKSYTSYIADAYKDWLKTQDEMFPLTDGSYSSWICNIPQMYSRRSPGAICIDTLSDGRYGSMLMPVNQSKGCDGVMRVAPIGAYFCDKHYTRDQIDMFGAEAAAITQGHPLGYIPAAALVHIVNMLIYEENISILEAVLDAKSTIKRIFKESQHIALMNSLIDRAIALSKEKIDDRQAIAQLGMGWVAEETLAIAVYCSLKYHDDFDKALIAAVNHDGDSDSTGALTGNILGAYLGMNSIPNKYLDKLELKNIIIEIADDLFYDCSHEDGLALKSKVWIQKYINADYLPQRRISRPLKSSKSKRIPKTVKKIFHNSLLCGIIC